MSELPNPAPPPERTAQTTTQPPVVFSNQQVQLGAPRWVYWLLGTVLLAGVAALGVASVQSRPTPQPLAFEARQLMWLWRTQTTFVTAPPEPPRRSKVGVSSVTKDAAAGPAVTATAVASEEATALATDPTKAAASSLEALLPIMLEAAATVSKDGNGQTVALVPAVAMATQQPATAAKLAAKLPTWPLELQVVMAALPATVTPVQALDGTAALALPEAISQAMAGTFAPDWSPYLRDRLRHRLLVTAADWSAASPRAAVLLEQDRAVAAASVTLFQLAALALLYGVFWWTLGLARTAAARARGEPALGWLGRRFAGLPPLAGYPTDPMVPFVGIAFWLGGHAVAGGLVQSLMGQRASGFAVLLSSGIGLLLAQVLVQWLASGPNALQSAALLGGKGGGSPSATSSVAALQVFAALLPPMLVVLFLTELVAGGGRAHPAAEMLLDRPEPIQALTVGLSAVLFAPLAEELIFRGLLLRSLVPLVGKGMALLVSSALFAAVHLSLEGSAAYLLLGAAFGGVYLWTGNLWAPIVLHMLWNTATMWLMLLLAWS